MMVYNKVKVKVKVKVKLSFAVAARDVLAIGG